MIKNITKALACQWESKSVPIMGIKKCTTVFKNFYDT